MKLNDKQILVAIAALNFTKSHSKAWDAQDEDLLRKLKANRAARNYEVYVGRYVGRKVDDLLRSRKF